MSRVVVTTAYTLPSGGLVPKGAVLEVTAAQAAAITSASGATRAVSATAGTGGAGNRDTLGESVGVSNASA
jgi:hypothetical protein